MAKRTKFVLCTPAPAHTRSPDKVADYCHERGLQLSARYEEVLSDRNIDAVVLATPNSPIKGDAPL